MDIIIKQFEELELSELYYILKLRFDIFVLEQQSIYDEFDTIDFIATHLFIKQNDDIIAYLRLYNKSNEIASFGRVAVHKNYRKKGISKLLISNTIEYIKEKNNISKVEIEAQEYLKEFYNSFGFRQISNAYEDGGVIHIDMELTL